MTAALLAGRSLKRFIPILAIGDLESAIPTWLGGRYFVDLRGRPFAEEQYQDLLNTLLGRRHVAPPVGKPNRPRPVPNVQPELTNAAAFEPIRLLGVIVDEVGTPRNDGTRGSALYAVPFRLSKQAPYDWGALFVEKWNRPPQFTTMHRPGIARVTGDRVILDGTTIEEVKSVHRDTLQIVLAETNRIYSEALQRQARAERAAREREDAHRRAVERLADDITFD